jgi:hypothetical protein
MRGWIAVAVLAGCGAPITPRALPAIEPLGLISPETYSAKTAGLRATLARNGIALDSAPEIRSCDGDARCVRCEVATRDDTRNVDPELIDGVAIAFARYPPPVYTSARLEHVALCRSIRYDGEHKIAPAGVAVSSEHRLLISIEGFADRPHDVYDYFTIEQVVHHELFHLIDRATLGELAEADAEWLALNRPGFEYVDPAATGAARPSGFVDSYATTNQLEDRASVFEYLMGQPAKLCAIAEDDPIVAAKTAVIWKRMASVLGDELLHRHAPCIGWVETRGAGLPKQLGPQPPERVPPPPGPELPRKKTLVGKMR